MKNQSEEARGRVIDQAATILNEGGVIVFPTETVYGIGARADLPQAMRRLRALKGREGDRPFTVHIGRRSEVERWVGTPGGLARRFIRKGLPGPLTLILSVEDPTSTPIHRELGAQAVGTIFHQNTVGLRYPDHDLTVAWLRRVSGPVVAGSANLPGAPPPRDPDEIAREVRDAADLVIEDGSCRYRNASTIIRVHRDTFEVMRDGVYDGRTLERLAALRILFVCTGNTCRSPMAAALCRALLAKRLGRRIDELEACRVVVESAGTHAGGDGPPPQAVGVMARRGLDVSNHVSQPLTREHLGGADYIFAMTRNHYDGILEIAPHVADRVELLDPDGRDVSDPFGGSEKMYEVCASNLEEALRRRINEIAL